MVIADRPLHEIVPAAARRGPRRAGRRERQRRTASPSAPYKIVTQYSMGPIEEIGLLKMDFLGLRNLDVIEDAVDDHRALARRARSTSRRSRSTTPRPTRCSPAGDSIGVFQFESEGMRDALRKVSPTEFDDLVALVALYRPGAMRYIPDYARGKRDPGVGPLPRRRACARSPSRPTAACIYQEQLMEIAKQMAGFSPAEADDLRKAIGKKKRDLMATMKDKFLEGLAASGTDRARRQGPLVADGGGRRLLASTVATPPATR